MSLDQKTLRFTTHASLAHRLTLSTLTGRPVRISQIRASSPIHPGLAPHEVSLLRLLDAITNGSHIEFSYTGTTLLYRPGLITGSVDGYGASKGVVTHDIPLDVTRGISYFLIPLALLAPFSKAPISVLFTEASSPPQRPTATSQSTRLNLELRVLRRSGQGPSGKAGAGEVHAVFGHQVRLPKTLHLLTPGKVRRVRGVAYAVGVAGANNARMIEAARGVLNPLAGDTYIFSDVSSAPLVDVNVNDKGASAEEGSGQDEEEDGHRGSASLSWRRRRRACSSPPTSRRLLEGRRARGYRTAVRVSTPRGGVRWRVREQVECGDGVDVDGHGCGREGDRESGEEDCVMRRLGWLSEAGSDACRVAGVNEARSVDGTRSETETRPWTNHSYGKNKTTTSSMIKIDRFTRNHRTYLTDSPALRSFALQRAGLDLTAQDGYLDANVSRCEHPSTRTSVDANILRRVHRREHPSTSTSRCELPSTQRPRPQTDRTS
ncbi:hypothetical protein MRB53_037060 [Persea americana]|nr:hypothetical protein MRB53_037060 [Persea americana]